MTRWEYRQVFGSEYELAAARATERLNELGADGWELVAALPCPGTDTGAIVSALYVLKRRLPSPDAVETTRFGDNQ